MRSLRVFVLGEKDTSSSGSNFQTKEISKVPQMFRVQRLLYYLFHRVNVTLIIPINQNIINIYQKYSVALQGILKK